MTASQVYDRYILKTEKNATNEGVTTDRQRFSEIYNEYQIRYTEYILGLKNEEDLREIETLLIKEKRLNKKSKQRDYFNFELPNNYLTLSSAYALGSKGECKNKKIFLPLEISDIESEYYLTDVFTQPSFEYRESFYSISAGNINVYYTDFNVDGTIISYYRYPKKITLLNPDNPESQFDDSYQLDFDERVINKIVTASASGFDINNNSDRWQLNNVFAKKEL